MRVHEASAGNEPAVGVAVEGRAESTGSTSRTIFDVVAERIGEWQLAPGRRITERELCDEFGASRTPVREALRRLEQAGYIERVGKRGYAVRHLDLKMLEDVYVVRAQLEDLSVLLAAGAVGTSAFEKLKVVAGASASDGDGAGSDPRRDYSAREEFHERLAELSGNLELVRLLRDIDIRIRGARRLDLMVPARAEMAQQEHREILLLLEQQRVADARQKMREHIEQSQSTIRVLARAGVSSIALSSTDRGLDDGAT